jgi:hypothetical protein
MGFGSGDGFTPGRNDVSGDFTVAGNISASSGVSAGSFTGDGSNLTNVGGGSLTITVGNTVASGAGNRILYESSANKLAESANLTFDGATLTVATLDANGGAIDDVTVGATTPSSVKATTLSGSGNADIDGTLQLNNTVTVKSGVSFAADTVNIDGGNIDGCTIATSDVTVGAGKTLNVSAGTLTTSTTQDVAILASAASNNDANLDFGAYDVKGQTLTSDVTTGTAPLTVSSTTVVTNLNADLLDGVDWAAPAALGSTTPAAVSATAVDVPDDGTVGNASVSDFITLAATQITIKDGAYDFDIASHDGTNGLALGGTVVTATAAQLNYVDGVTSAIQTQLDAKQATLTFGIADTNALQVDQTTTAADDDYAKFTATGIEGRSYSEVKTDLSLGNVEDTALSTWVGTTNVTTLGTVATGDWQATDVAVAHGGTGASTEGDARTNLGLVIGTNVQAWDADLDTLSGMQSGAPGALALLTQTEIEILDGATVTSAELNLLDASVVTEPADGAWASLTRWAKAEYDFGADPGAGAISTIDLGVTIPDNAIITGGFIDVLTGFTSAGSATVSIGVQGTADMVAANTLSSLGYDSAGVQSIIPAGTGATAVKVDDASGKAITLTIGTADLTAGKANVWLQYVISEA